jgi:hypothetical protein
MVIDLLARRARQMKLLGGDPGVPENNCVQWALALAALLRQRHGLPAMFQAGTAGWKLVADHLDDGASANRFSYEWDPEAAPLMLAAGVLPEMHAWVVIPAGRRRDDETMAEVIDPTAGAQPDNCRRLIGRDWTARRPPKYVWCLARELEANGWIYRADRAAMLTAMAVGRAILGGSFVVDQEELIGPDGRLCV